MKSINKILAFFIIPIVLMNFFIGCSKSKQKLDKNTIVVWANIIDSEVSEFQKIADKWSKENNTKVVIYATQNTGADLIKTYEKERPDIFFGVSAEDAGRLVKAKAVDEVPESLFPKDQYASNDLIQATSIDGVQYGVPLTQETVLLYYNKDLVDKVPSTMEELLNDAKTKGFSFASTDYFFSYGIVASQGGYVFKNNNGVFDYKDIGVNNEGAIKGYKFLQDMYKNNSNMLAGATDMYASNKFENGKIAYYIGEAGRIRTFNNKGSVNFGLATIPSVNGKEVTPFKYVKMATVSSSSTKKQKVWDLLKTFTESSDEIFMKTGPYAPTFKKSLDTDAYKNSKYASTLLEQCNKSMILPNIVENESMNIAMPAHMESLVMNKITPEQCGKEMEKDIKKAIKDVLTY